MPQQTRCPDQELTAQQRLINGEIHTVIDGNPNWTHVTFCTPAPGRKPTWRDRDVFVYYQGRMVTHLKQQRHALVESHDHHLRYPTLSKVIETYQHGSLVPFIERTNREEEIRDWCHEQRAHWGYLFFRMALFEVREMEHLLEHAEGTGPTGERETVEELAVRLLRIGLKAVRQDARLLR